MITGSLLLVVALILFYFLESDGPPTAVLFIGFALMVVGWREQKLW
jgi:hypothetical protein